MPPEAFARTWAIVSANFGYTILRSRTKCLRTPTAREMDIGPQTIQIFLPDGNPRGIRIAEITTRIAQAIEIPRSLLADFYKMQESQQVSVYTLVEELGDDDEPKVYVGQTGDLKSRMSIHNKEKRLVDLVTRNVSEGKSVSTRLRFGLRFGHYPVASQ